MDDDIRNRFRGVGRGSSEPSYSGRPARPVRPAASVSPAARPAAKTDWLGNKTVAKPAPKPEPKPAKPVKKAKTKRGKAKKRIFIGLILLFVLAAGGYGAYSYIGKNKTDQQFEQELKTPQAAQPEVKPTGTIRLIATGNNFAYESVNSAAKQADGSVNYLPMMNGFKTFFDRSDIRLCHQTTPGGGDTDGLAISAYPTFNAPREWSSGFAALGCNLVGLASDHMNDKGQVAIDNTLKTWDSAQNVLAVAGANRSAEEQAKIRYFSVKSVKFAYLAYTTTSQNNPAAPFGVNIYSDELASQQVAEARKNAQLVIVSMHWGGEEAADITADMDRIAQHLASLNVDVVVGGGPRVVHPAKILGGSEGHQTLVWFSLGNFLNSELPANNLIGGMAVMDFDVASLQIKDPKLMPVYMHYEWTAAQKAANQVNSRHSFLLWPLDLAGEPLARSQNGTTVEAQTIRITGVITKFVPIKVIKSTEF